MNIASWFRNADRAEALARGVGSLAMLIVAGLLLPVMPRLFTSLDYWQKVDTFLQLTFACASMALCNEVLGLLLWFRVQDRGRARLPGNSALATNIRSGSVR